MLLFMLIPILVGGFYIITGLRVILTKRPVILSSRPLRIILLIAFLPVLLLSLVHFQPSSIIALGFWGLLLVLVLKQSGGYAIYGLCNPELREVMLATLKAMNATYQEDMSGITIPSENLKLEPISINMGVSRIRVRKKIHAIWLTKFVDAMRKYLQTASVKVTTGYSVFMCALGVLLILLPVSRMH